MPAGTYAVGMSRAVREAFLREAPGWFDRAWMDGAAPARAVRLPAYAIMRCEVTHGEYARFRPSHAPPAGETPRHPARNVTYADAAAYAAWLTRSRDDGGVYRLPTGDEWEVAGRGRDGRRWPWGDAWREGVSQTGAAGPAAVGSHPGGASPFGVLDLSGNVGEWTSDRGRRDGGPARLVRGCSWGDRRMMVSMLTRIAVAEGQTHETIGFRLVRVPRR